MSKKKSKPRHRGDYGASSSTTSMIVDEVHDYEYFKELWNEKMMGTKQQGDNDDAKSAATSKQSSVRQKQDAEMHQPKRKRRKLPATDDGTTNKTTRKGKKMKMQKVSTNNDKPTSQLHHYYDDDTIIAANGVEGRKGGSTSKKRKRAAGNESTTQHNSAGIESKYDAPLYEHISKHQLDTLLGWAASHRGNDDNNIDTTTSAEKEGEIDLSHLPMAPPPPSHVAFLQQHMSQRLQNNNYANYKLDDIGEKKKGDNCKTATTTKQNNNTMHVSAYVAVGMAVEEALTTRLMPLAKAHVERCRRLEREARDHAAECQREESITKTQSSQKKLLKRLAAAKHTFDAWTLPPAEALMQLARDGTIKGNDALTSSLLFGRQSELEDSE